MTSVAAKIESVLNKTELSRDEKIDRLLRMRTDSRAAQRAATESAMDAPDTLQTDLKEIDVALRELGYEATEDEESAATL